MKPSPRSLALLATAQCLAVQAAKHHMFVGSYGTPAIYSLEFDNVANTLTAVPNNTTRPENEWLALSYDSKTLYSSGKSGWSSFNITSSGRLTSESDALAPGGKSCGNWNGVYVMASKRPPYPLYGSLTCANWVSVLPGGNVGQAVEVPYNEGVIIYGMATSPTYSHLYSGDWKNGVIWVHKINDDGSLTVVGSVTAPSSASAPRTLQVHPSGRALYVVLEAWNALALYYVNATTGMPEYTNALYPLVPEGTDAGSYGAQSASLSPKGSIIYISAHSRVPGKPGYITALSLTEVGLPTGQLWQVPVTDAQGKPVSGGKSLNVKACPWNEEVFAVADSELGGVSVWGSNSPAGAGGAPVRLAGVEVKDNGGVGDGGCCSDVVWLD